MIEKEGYPYNLLTATTTPEALRTFKKSKPDLILAANELSDDQELFKKIRIMPEGLKVPFIIICSSYDEEIISMLGKQGACIIVSPFRISELLSVIQASLADSYP